MISAGISAGQDGSLGGKICCHERLTSSIADVHQSIADGWQAKHYAQGPQPRSHEFIFGLSVLCIPRADGILLPANTEVLVVIIFPCRLLKAVKA